MKHEILSLLLKLWLICVICFITFCVSRYFNHFPKHDERHAVKTTEAAFSKIATFLAVGPALFGYNIDKAKELLFPPAVSKKRLPGIGGVRSIKDMPFVFGGEAQKIASPPVVEMYEAVKNRGEFLRNFKEGQVKLTKEQREILSHASRNGFYCGEESKELDELCAEGLMCCAGKKGFAPDMYYRITEAGRRVK